MKAYWLCFLTVVISVRKTAAIVWGDNVTIEERPYHVAIIFWSCCYWGNGAIISDRYVLTNEFALGEPNRPELHQVRAGSMMSESGGILVDVKEFIRNFDYEMRIVIMKLKDALPILPSIQPIALPDENQVVEDGMAAIVTGFGSDDKVLKQVPITVINLNTCNFTFDYILYPFDYCAGVTQVEMFKDFAAPLVINNTLMGSFLRPRFKYNLTTGLYFEVSAFRHWIRNNTGL